VYRPTVDILAPQFSTDKLIIHHPDLFGNKSTSFYLRIPQQSTVSWDAKVFVHEYLQVPVVPENLMHIAIIIADMSFIMLLRPADKDKLGWAEPVERTVWVPSSAVFAAA
jgi:hypothetical protein